jgi:hypothetical protein
LLVDFVLQTPYNAPTYERTDVSVYCIHYDRDGFHRWDDGYGHVRLLQEGSPDCGKTSVVYLSTNPNRDQRAAHGSPFFVGGMVGA